LTDENLETVDFFFMAGGSDYRACEVLRKLVGKKAVDHVVFFKFQERTTDLEESDHFHDYKKLKGNRITEIACTIRDPSACLDQLILLESEITSTKTIAIDISCFTKPYFFYLIRLFKDRFGVEFLKVFYTEPQSYLFPQGLFSSFHSSKGPIEIIEMPGYTGIETFQDKRGLVVLLGFDGDLSKEINEDISPSKTFVINGFPGYAPKFKDISLVANEKLTSDQNVKVLFSRANNPFETFNLLERLKMKGNGLFMNIAPLGTKPMALGACLFALNNPEVRVIYPMPETYEKVITAKCWHSWIYKIPLKLEPTEVQ
jgi:hypothetical protein